MYDFQEKKKSKTSPKRNMKGKECESPSKWKERMEKKYQFSSIFNLASYINILYLI